jgi:hypothetical protein
MPTGGEREREGEREGERRKGRRSDDWWMGAAQWWMGAENGERERVKEKKKEKKRKKKENGCAWWRPSPSLSTERVGAGRVLMALTGMCGSRHRSTNGEPARGDPPKP